MAIHQLLRNKVHRPRRSNRYVFTHGEPPQWPLCGGAQRPLRRFSVHKDNLLWRKLIFCL